MAKAPTLAQVERAFQKWGVPYKVVSGAATRGNGGSFGTSLTGVMFHHTGDDAADWVDLKVVTNGHGSLPGPLCNFGVGDDGKVYIVASSRPANHAGGGDPDVLKAVQKESYGDYPPKTDKHHGEAGSVGGNSYFMGWEVFYGGGTDLVIEASQYRSTILSMVAIIDLLDELDGASATWTSKSMIGHKEWSDWKPDPRGVDMKTARGDAQWCLDKGPAAAKIWHKTGKKGEALVSTLDKDDIKAIGNEMLRVLTEVREFRVHSTYDPVTNELLPADQREVKKGSLEYALWCAIRDSRQSRDLGRILVTTGEDRFEEIVKDALAANPGGTDPKAVANAILSSLGTLAASELEKQETETVSTPVEEVPAP